MRRSALVILWAVTVAWAAQIYNFSTATFGGVFTTWLLSQILRFVHATVSIHTFVMLHHLMRKGAHLTEYTLFSMLLYYSLGRRREWRRRPAIWALIIAGLYSLSAEFHQLFVPGRGPSIFDSAIDTAGACVGILIVYVVCRIDRNSRKAPKEPIPVKASS